jgi:flagellar motility protein MotE (MotC chaperone)
VVYDIGKHNGDLFIVMELLRGRDLSAELAANPAGLPPARVVLLAIQAVRALDAAHKEGVVHRDLKPANLFLLDIGLVKICDFGIAKVADATTLTAPGSVFGTPAYMSPEQFLDSAAVTERSDLYSLGCVLYEMLTGHPPFTATGIPALLNHHLNVIPNPPQGRYGIPGDLSDLVLHLLAKNPADRPATAQEVLTSLTRIGTVARQSVPGSPPQPGQPSPQPTQRQPTGDAARARQDAERFRGRHPQDVAKELQAMPPARAACVLECLASGEDQPAKEFAELFRITRTGAAAVLTAMDGKKAAALLLASNGLWSTISASEVLAQLAPPDLLSMVSSLEQALGSRYNLSRRLAREKVAEDYLSELDPRQIAAALAYAHLDAARDLLDSVPGGAGAAIVSAMDRQKARAILTGMEESRLEKIIEWLEPADAEALLGRQAR